MATYVLIHGAWHGGWCWKKVTPLLRARGHAVYAPTLTGLGERAHLAHPGIDLNTHVQDVVNLLWYEDLNEVIAVGHSYGGMVMTGVAEHCAERISHLVYLDAFVPANGQSLFDCVSPEVRSSVTESARSNGDGWRIPSGDAERFGVTDADDLEWVRPRLVAQPLATFEQPVRCPSSSVENAPRTYVYCTQFGTTFARFSADAQGDPSWSYHELETGHDAMITAPEAVAELLLGVAEMSGPRHRPA